MRIQIVVLALCVGCGSGGDDAGPDAPIGGAGGGAGAGVGGQTTGSAGVGSVGGVGGVAGVADNDGAGASGEDGEGGSGVRDPGDTSKTEACLEYGAARIARFNECSGLLPMRDPQDLERGLEDCPDQYFSDGSTRTVAGLLDCAAQMRTFPCAELEAGRVPACVTAGTRAGGEACVFLTQCASLRCSAYGDTCGTCSSAAAAGEACDGVDVTCPANHTCDGVCVELPLERPPPTTPDPPATKPTGAECANHAECTAPDLCFDDQGDGVQRCRPRVSLGEGCAGPTQYCFDEHYCDPNDDTCKVKPGNGETCGLHFGEPSYCADLLRCVLDDPAGPTCRPAPGFECEAAGLTCEPGSSCCTSPDCAVPTCLRGLRPGEACGDPSARCVHGTRCEGGTCVADDTVTVFAMLCGMP